MDRSRSLVGAAGLLLILTPVLFTHPRREPAPARGPSPRVQGQALFRSSVAADLLAPEVLLLQAEVFAELEALEDASLGIEHLGAWLEEAFGLNQIPEAPTVKYLMRKNPVTCLPEFVCCESGVFVVRLGGRSIEVIVQEVVRIL